MLDHVLTIHTKYFTQIDNGVKKFEIRPDNKAFQVNSFVRFCEYDPVMTRRTGKWIRVKIIYIERGDQDGTGRLNAEYCVFGFLVIERGADKWARLN